MSLAEDDYFSNNIISKGPSLKKIKDSSACENMRNAYLYFYNQINSYIANKSMNSQIETLYHMRNQFWDNFEIMYLETNDAGEAYVIFETLNARGKDLEIADLLKNYVFSQAGENIKKVQGNWKAIVDELSGLDLYKIYSLLLERSLYSYP